jgi:hypothetical protein
VCALQCLIVLGECPRQGIGEGMPLSHGAIFIKPKFGKLRLAMGKVFFETRLSKHWSGRRNVQSRYF